jgi:glycosyltransferase involved in cell wall biosynthesis
MRIGLITSAVSGGTTGTGQYIVALTRALLTRDEPPELVLFALEADLPLFEFCSRRTTVVTMPEACRELAPFAEWIEKQLPELARQHDLEAIHLPDYRRIQWREELPLVVTVHDLAPIQTAQKKPGFLERIVGRKPAPRSPAFIATSDFVACSLQAHLDLPARSIAVIYPGIDHERFHPGRGIEAKTTIDAQYDLKEPFFLCAGRLDHPVGNHVGLIAAFNRFKRRTKSRWMLMLAGEAGESVEAIHTAVRESPFVSDIRMVDRVPDKERPTLYQAADAFVYPTLQEVPDLTVVEAMACGCPVISSQRAALGEWVGEASSLINPEDMDDIAGKLAAMAGGLELRERWRRSSLAQARKFDWQRTGTETISVYERVAPPR